MARTDTLARLLQDQKGDLVKTWLDGLGGAGKAASAKAEAAEIFASFSEAVASGKEPGADSWVPLRKLLGSLSASRAAQGLSAGETSAFVLGLKRPLFAALQAQVKDGEELVAAITRVSDYLDAAAQWTADAYQVSRESVIERQQQELLELSTPVIKLWDGVLAVPMIGTLDSNRTQLVMEALLQRIVDTESSIAIIDITGVPTVDTLVAQHLLKTVTAIRLMGADCIISGIRPQIAQTIVHLGIDLQSVSSKATLADALAMAMKRTGYVFTKAGA